MLPEPRPLQIKPTCPDWLHPFAREHWAHLAPELDRLGLLSVLDLGPFALLCQAYADWRVNIEFVLLTKGGVYRTPGGFLAAVPQVSMANQAAASYHRLAVEWGMTPSSRTRLADPRFALFDESDDSDLDPWGPA